MGDAGIEEKSPRSKLAKRRVLPAVFILLGVILAYHAKLSRDRRSKLSFGDVVDSMAEDASEALILGRQTAASYEQFDPRKRPLGDPAGRPRELLRGMLDPLIASAAGGKPLGWVDVYGLLQARGVDPTSRMAFMDYPLGLGEDPAGAAPEGARRVHVAVVGGLSWKNQGKDDLPQGVRSRCFAIVEAEGSREAGETRFEVVPVKEVPDTAGGVRVHFRLAYSLSAEVEPADLKEALETAVSRARRRKQGGRALGRELTPSTYAVYCAGEADARTVWALTDLAERFSWTPYEAFAGGSLTQDSGAVGLAIAVVIAIVVVLVWFVSSGSLWRHPVMLRSSGRNVLHSSLVLLILPGICWGMLGLFSSNLDFSWSYKAYLRFLYGGAVLLVVALVGFFRHLLAAHIWDKGNRLSHAGRASAVGRYLFNRARWSPVLWLGEIPSTAIAYIVSPLARAVWFLKKKIPGGPSAGARRETDAGSGSAGRSGEREAKEPASGHASDPSPPRAGAPGGRPATSADGRAGTSGSAGWAAREAAEWVAEKILGANVMAIIGLGCFVYGVSLFFFFIGFRMMGTAYTNVVGYSLIPLMMLLLRWCYGRLFGRRRAEGHGGPFRNQKGIIDYPGEASSPWTFTYTFAGLLLILFFWLAYYGNLVLSTSWITSKVLSPGFIVVFFGFGITWAAYLMIAGWWHDPDIAHAGAGRRRPCDAGDDGGAGEAADRRPERPDEDLSAPLICNAAKAGIAMLAGAIFMRFVTVPVTGRVFGSLFGGRFPEVLSLAEEFAYDRSAGWMHTLGRLADFGWAGILMVLVSTCLADLSLYLGVDQYAKWSREKGFEKTFGVDSWNVIFAYIEPLFAVILGVAVLGETIASPALIGAVVGTFIVCMLSRAMDGCEKLVAAKKDVVGQAGFLKLQEESRWQEDRHGLDLPAEGEVIENVGDHRNRNRDDLEKLAEVVAISVSSPSLVLKEFTGVCRVVMLADLELCDERLGGEGRDRARQMRRAVKNRLVYLALAADPEQFAAAPLLEPAVVFIQGGRYLFPRQSELMDYLASYLKHFHLFIDEMEHIRRRLPADPHRDGDLAEVRRGLVEWLKRGEPRTIYAGDTDVCMLALVARAALGDSAGDDGRAPPPRATESYPSDLVAEFCDYVKTRVRFYLISPNAVLGNVSFRAPGGQEAVIEPEAPAYFAAQAMPGYPSLQRKLMDMGARKDFRFEVHQEDTMLCRVTGDKRGARSALVDAEDLRNAEDPVSLLEWRGGEAEERARRAAGARSRQAVRVHPYSTVKSPLHDPRWVLRPETIGEFFARRFFERKLKAHAVRIKVLAIDDKAHADRARATLRYHPDDSPRDLEGWVDWLYWGTIPDPRHREGDWWRTAADADVILLDITFGGSEDKINLGKAIEPQISAVSSAVVCIWTEPPEERYDGDETARWRSVYKEGREFEVRFGIDRRDAPPLPDDHQSITYWLARFLGRTVFRAQKSFSAFAADMPRADTLQTWLSELVAETCKKDYDEYGSLVAASVTQESTPDAAKD